jgi:hypothetical protein
MLFSITAFSQDLCAERGHVQSGMVSVTGMYCPPYLIETDSTTVKVYPSCNEYKYVCLRCDQLVIESEPERREVIWRKEK